MTGEETIPYIILRIQNTDLEIKELEILQKFIEDRIQWKKADDKEVEKLSAKRFREELALTRREFNRKMAHLNKKYKVSR